MTNYKKIRKMNKKKMAEFLLSHSDGCRVCAYLGECGGKACEKGVRKWLESEAKE